MYDDPLGRCLSSYTESIDIKTRIDLFIDLYFMRQLDVMYFAEGFQMLRVVFTVDRRGIWAHCKVRGFGLPLGFILIDIIVTVLHVKDREI